MSTSADWLIVPILRILSDGNYCSLSSLASQLHSTPTIISNAIEVIDRDGLADVAKLDGLGYRCCSPIVWLDPSVILHFSGSASISLHFAIHIIDTIESTNAFLLSKINVYQCSNDRVTVVAAEYQTGGRGRLGRKWYTGVGDSLTFSLRWYFMQDASKLAGLSLVIGIAIIRVLKLFAIEYANLKWPNDVLFNSQKLAGILIELRGNVTGSCFAIIGIGINFELSDKIKATVNQDQSITDLFAITGKKIDRNIFLGFLLAELYGILQDFEQKGFSFFKQEWLSYQCYDGNFVKLTLPDSTVIEGIVAGINDDGSINLITSSGEKSFNVGDISIRLK